MPIILDRQDLKQEFHAFETNRAYGISRKVQASHPSLQRDA